MKTTKSAIYLQTTPNLHHSYKHFNEDTILPLALIRLLEQISIIISV